MLDDPDAYAIRTWQYPVNMPKRQYQHDIVKDCLLANTLVVLPPGLGKTFIASVILHNYLRWFPNKKVVFLSPTKALLRQQAQATLSTTEIRPERMTELTLGQSLTQRHDAWLSKSVVLCAPQVLRNDLISGVCSLDNIVLLIFDEAHCAIKSHPYCVITRQLKSQDRLECVRIIGLTSTPGAAISTLQDIVSNLFISKVVVRTKDSPDVISHVAHRGIECIMVPEDSSIRFVRTQFEQHILYPLIARSRALEYGLDVDIGSLSHIQLVELHRKIRSGRRGKFLAQECAAEEMLVVLAQLRYAYELLASYGLAPFRNFLARLSAEGGVTIQDPLCKMLELDPAFQQLMAYVDKFLESPLCSSHPKIDFVEERLCKFLSETQDSRTIILSQCRDNVFELNTRLARNSPILRVMTFAKEAPEEGKRDQKISYKRQQLEAPRQFRTGGYNVLVSTGMDEEALGVLEADLIIGFDVHSFSAYLRETYGPRRSNVGQAILILAEGLEERQYSDLILQQKNLLQTMCDPTALTLYCPNRSLIPGEPTCVERVFLGGSRLEDSVSVKKRGRLQKRSVRTSSSEKPASAKVNERGLSSSTAKCHTDGQSHTTSCPGCSVQGWAEVSEQQRSDKSKESLFEERLRACILEMRNFRNTEITRSSWDSCSNDFETIFRASCTRNLQSISLDLPADFFDCSDMDEVATSPVKCETEYTKSSDTMPAIRCIQRAGAFRISSSVPSEADKGQHSKVYGRFVDDEAICSNPSDSSSEDEEVSASMAQFIIDGTGTSENGDENVDDDMMAFYRRTAHASQDDPMFAQPPKSFASFRRPLNQDPTAKAMDANHNTEFGSFDWASDLEIP